MSTAFASVPVEHTLPSLRSDTPSARSARKASAGHYTYRLPENNGLCFHWDMTRDMTRSDRSIMRERLRDSHSSLVWNKSLPAAQTWVANLALGLVEILQGTRPLAQVRRWVLPELYDELALARGCVNTQGIKPGRCSLIRWRTCHISERIVESCVIVQTRGRRRTVSVRIEEYRGRWIATALDVL